MVRKKSCPFRSLQAIDYNHPNLAIWFFGHLSSSKIPTENKDTPRTLEQHSKTKKVIETLAGSTKNSLLHPLSSQSNLPPLTDLQCFITESILSSEGTSCSFDDIYDYVSKRWSSVRRRDGSNYTTDCRRAIQANLRYNPNHIALFKKDKKHEGNWTVCITVEDANEASRERAAERKVTQAKRLERSLASDLKPEPSQRRGSSDDDGDSASDDDVNADSDSPLHKRTRKHNKVNGRKKTKSRKSIRR
eukprot:TRINITY_DN5985_c1_g2_i2.p1 TRINITY_DN5985_c1_g2~~TRINITY_DN5985_c1_g2_i2.p1  ORF type:complete len:247 (-),score=24.53 TRINITY_DN5985_c1_g2_i2:413-1153(-)